MALNHNGILYTNIQDLEVAIQSLPEVEKQAILNDFNGVPNTPVSDNIPKVVTPRQIRLALVVSGIPISVIESTIDSLPEPQKSMTRITWEYSTEFQRSNPMLAAMSPMLGLTSEQVDNLFVLAATL